MNEAGIAAIKKELSGVEDNLGRARRQQQQDPSWVSGNGEGIHEVIDEYERLKYELEAALAEAQGR